MTKNLFIVIYMCSMVALITYVVNVPCNVSNVKYTKERCVLLESCESIPYNSLGPSCKMMLRQKKEGVCYGEIKDKGYKNIITVKQQRCLIKSYNFSSLSFVFGYNNTLHKSYCDCGDDVCDRNLVIPDSNSTCYAIRYARGPKNIVYDTVEFIVTAVGIAFIIILMVHATCGSV